MHSQGQAREPSNPTGMPATDDEIREKYLERAIRELNAFAREVQSCTHCPRGQLMPVLGSGHPQADIFLIKYSPRPVGGRGGRRVLRPHRQRADEVAQAPVDRPARPSTGRCASSARCPIPRWPTPACIARLAEELAIVSPKIVVVMGPDALGGGQRAGHPAAPRAQPRPRASSSASRRRSRRCTSRTSTTRSTRRAPSASSGPRSASSGLVGGPARPTELAAAGITLAPHGPRREDSRPGRRPLRGVRSEADHSRAPGRARVGRPGALLDSRGRGRARARRRRGWVHRGVITRAAARLGSARLYVNIASTTLPNLPPAVNRS